MTRCPGAMDPVQKDPPQQRMPHLHRPRWHPALGDTARWHPAVGNAAWRHPDTEEGVGEGEKSRQEEAGVTSPYPSVGPVGILSAFSILPPRFINNVLIIHGRQNSSPQNKPGTSPETFSSVAARQRHQQPRVYKSTWSSIQYAGQSSPWIPS